MFDRTCWCSANSGHVTRWWLRAALEDVGLPFVVTSNPAPNRNGLLVASKWPLANPAFVSAPEVDRERWLPLRITEVDLDVLAVHIPGAPDNKFEDGYGISGAKRKELMWERILAYAVEHHDQRAMVVGDFNTGLRLDAEGAMFKKSHYMHCLIDTAFADTWRHQHRHVRDYTWYTKRKDKDTLQLRTSMDQARLPLRLPATAAHEPAVTLDRPGWIVVDTSTMQTQHPGIFAIGDTTAVTSPSGRPFPKAAIFVKKRR
jgi:hypothetical protein